MKRQVVICVDDEILVLTSLRAELKEALGQENLIEIAESGSEALELVEELLADGYEIPLVISDYIMPTMKGDELLKQIHQRSPKTLNIMLTGQASIDAVTNAIRDARLYRYIAKPWQEEDLRLTVTEAINRYVQEKQLAEQRLQLIQLNQALEEANHTLEQRVRDRTQELSEALDHLQAMQESLIHSEKMAALGQLVAGVAHEINTPMGAIRTSVSIILSTLERSLSQLPQLFQTLSPERQADFYTLLKLAQQHQDSLSSREERQFRRTLATQLEAQGLDDATHLAAQLVELGIRHDISPIHALLHDANRDFILETARSLILQKQSSENIQLAVEKASKIIFALKNYSHQSETSEPTQAQLKDGIELVLTIYQNNLKHGIEVNKQYDDVPAIYCYPDELNQVWTNLIHNAIQAMSGQGTLDIYLFQQNNDEIVQITDSGSGIPDDLKAKIFDPFFTTKPLGEGSGLGLSIVRQIIEKHRGTISVDSQAGRTVFQVALPISSAGSQP